jgi:hypothetical protein
MEKNEKMKKCKHFSLLDPEVAIPDDSTALWMWAVRRYFELLSKTHIRITYRLVQSGSARLQLQAIRDGIPFLVFLDGK